MISFGSGKGGRQQTRWLAAIGAGVCVLALLASGSCVKAATVDRYWEFSTYRIQVFIDYGTSVVWEERLKPQLPRYLQQRAGVAVGPLWRLTVDSPPDDAGPPSEKQLLGISSESLAEIRRDYDKLMVLHIEEGPLGFTISVQEYDSLLERWGPVVSHATRDGTSLRDLAFATLEEAFMPLATFRVIRDAPDQVELKFRGSLLPRTSVNTQLVKPGDVYRPILRRVDRTGQAVEDGIQPVTWTYLSVNPSEGDAITATVHSHTRAPLGVRQRGRVDQLAAFVRIGDTTTRLRLHARDSEGVPLAGFPVYQRDTDDEDQTYTGKTGRDGAIAIPPGETPIQVTFVQSSGQWIAKIPVVPGADDLVEAPLVDDRKRLEAEARLRGIREELIDIVARRNILAARVRAKIKANDINAANRLIQELEDLPSATEFEQQRIRQQEVLTESDDPRIQQRIDQLFSDTRDVLSEYLAPGLVQELKREIAAAGSTAQQ